MCAGTQARCTHQQTNVGLTIMSAAWAVSQPHWAVEGESAPRHQNMNTAERRSVPGLAGILAAATTLLMALSGCASGRWFDSHPQANAAALQASSASDFNSQAATYVRDVCALPREQRDMRVRALNEALLPNHANISCGRGGTPDQ